MVIANYIIEIFKLRIFTVMSWGFSSPIAIENGLKFEVRGFIHKGMVEVTYDEGYDLFSVRTLNADGSTKTMQDGIYLDGLVDTIDKLVEYCPNYEERVRKTYFA